LVAELRYSAAAFAEKAGQRRSEESKTFEMVGDEP
jgi:hypothetical protein